MTGEPWGLISVFTNIMINLTKLNFQFNMKNFDAAKLTEALSGYQNFLIKLVLITVSLLIAGLIFNDHRLKDQDLRVLTSQAQAKLEVIKARDEAIRDLKNFKSSLPKKLNESELIALISNYAKLCRVNTVSLSPAESRDVGLYDVINISFNAVSHNFKEMMFFLRTIETSNFPLRVDSWSGNEGNNGEITFSINISAVVIHR